MTKAPTLSALRERFKNTLPVWPVGRDGRCTCPVLNCRRPGKHADADAPETGPYAVATGAESGILVIDPDVKGGVDGLEQLEHLEKQLGPLPRTLEIVTPSGGAHVYVQHPGCHANGKLASAIDLKGDKAREDGLVYVVGPGSPGYVKTADPCVVVPAEPYTVTCDAQIAALPDGWVGFLLEKGTQPRSAFAPEPIEASDPEYENRVALGVEYAKTMPESRGDGEGGKRLFALARVLVRKLQLPLDVARDIILKHFNPRCTYANGAAYPWEPNDVDHKLLDARDRSDDECGIERLPMPVVVADVRAGLARLRETKHERALERMAEPIAGDAPHAYDFEYGKAAVQTTEKITRERLINVLSGLESVKWKNVLRYDVLRGGVSASKPPIELPGAQSTTFDEDDAERVSYWLACELGLSASPDVVLRVVPSLARQRSYNPLLEYFASLPPSEGAIDELCGLLGATTDLTRTYVRKFLLAAVRRAVRPGCKSDSVLALLGEPGAGKSSTVQALFGEEWTSESLPDLSNVKAVGEALASKWCVELAELAEIFRSQRDTATAFITRLTDRYRAAYARTAKDHPRMCVLIASVNGSEIYSDMHGADIRRLWVVETPTAIDTARIRAIRDRVWSEAYAATVGDVWTGSMLVCGPPHWLSAEEKVAHELRSTEFREQDAWRATVAEYAKGREEVIVSDVLRAALGIPTKDQTKRETNRVAKVLRGLECVEKRGVMRDGVKVNVWTVPASLNSLTAKHPIVARLK